MILVAPSTYIFCRSLSSRIFPSFSLTFSFFHRMPSTPTPAQRHLLSRNLRTSSIHSAARSAHAPQRRPRSLHHSHLRHHRFCHRRRARLSRKAGGQRPGSRGSARLSQQPRKHARRLRRRSDRRRRARATNMASPRLSARALSAASSFRASQRTTDKQMQADMEGDDGARMQGAASSSVTSLPAPRLGGASSLPPPSSAARHCRRRHRLHREKTSFTNLGIIFFLAGRLG
ncbi:hypothetical protein B0H16DRAFT_94767 [Mycena metata]|uniref:Uncharacterized protein n=1 Tax=Mycena metata TaxID=1033252 RepID=A0AAD7MZ71_9AGAR|nr:hypothetical protein B0H16DRAFT_94767 [Mycena metata]